MQSRADRNKLLTILNIFLVIFLLTSCSKNGDKPKDISHYEIWKYDNLIVEEDKQIDYIDSMLKIYPESEYFHGMRIMMLANLGMKDSAVNYHNFIATKYRGINGTFMKMGFAQAIMVYQFSNGWLDHERIFLEAMYLDNRRVNIWARIGAYDIAMDDAENAEDLTEEMRNELYLKAEKYLLDAYEINPTNSYVLHLLSDFYLYTGNLQSARMYLGEVHPSYFPEIIERIRSTLDSLTNKNSE